MDPNLALTTTQSPLVTEEMRRRAYLAYLQNKALEPIKSPISPALTGGVLGGVAGSFLLPGLGSIMGAIIGAGIANKMHTDEQNEITRAQWILNQPSLQQVIAPNQVIAPTHNQSNIRKIINNAN